MTTITYRELVERVATSRGTVLGYSRDDSGLVHGPMAMSIYKERGEVVDGYSFTRLPNAMAAPIEGGEMYPAAAADCIPVIELMGWPHAAAAEVATGVLLALKD